MCPSKGIRECRRCQAYDISFAVAVYIAYQAWELILLAQPPAFTPKFVIHLVGVM
jgi:hypothetical protein